MYPAPGHRLARPRQLERELAEPVLPGDEDQQQRPEHEQMSVGRRVAESGRRLGPDRAASRRAPRTSRPARRRRQEQPLRDVLVERQREDEEAHVLVEQGIGDAEVAPVQPEQRCAASRVSTTVRPTSEPRSRPRPRAARSSRTRRSRLVVRRLPGSRPSRRRGALGDPEVDQQEGRRPQPGEAARQPPGSRAASRRPVLAELVEPHAVGLEVCGDPRQQRRDASAADQQRGARARPPPPRAPAARRAPRGAVIAAVLGGRAGA